YERCRPGALTRRPFDTAIMRIAACVLCALMFASGCATYDRRGIDPALAEQIENTKVRRSFKPADEMRQKILALDPEHVTAQDIQDVLSKVPAPRIINIHGGIY